MGTGVPKMGKVGNVQVGFAFERKKERKKERKEKTSFFTFRQFHQGL
jgi:hypothetical protein